LGLGTRTQKRVLGRNGRGLLGKVLGKTGETSGGFVGNQSRHHTLAPERKRRNLQRGGKYSKKLERPRGRKKVMGGTRNRVKGEWCWGTGT